jgi:hypothetical protein
MPQRAAAPPICALGYANAPRKAFAFAAISRAYIVPLEDKVHSSAKVSLVEKPF